MIISISGQLGSGKSTVGKLLAKALSYKHYSTGDFWRALAAEKDLDVYEFNKLAETDPSIDTQIDEYSSELGKKEDNFVIDSRLAWHFIPHSFKVRLTVDPTEGARRVYQDSERHNEQSHTDIMTAAHANEKRDQSERQRYIDYYNIDITKPENFDLVIDTTKISPEEVLQKIIESLPEDN